MRRASAYLHADGDAATVQELSAALISSRPLILAQNVNIYDTDDMKVGINLDLLAHASNMITSLVEIDNRGGIFIQQHMGKALLSIFAEDDHKNNLIARTLHMQKPYEEIVDHIAYRVRVMLSHIRIVFDASGEDKHHPLASIFSVMNKPNTLFDARKVRRQQRLNNRPHPFLCFRAADAEGPEEEISVVTRYYDGEARVAQMLMSDGALINADRYEPGGDGFVVAKWLDPPAELGLEIPNTLLVGNTISPKPMQVPNTEHTLQVLKRPGGKQRNNVKKAKSMSEDDDFKGELKAEPKDEEHSAEENAEKMGENTEEGESEEQVVIKTRPGHGNKMTLVLLGSSASDKAQIVEVAPNQCVGADMSPKMACDAIAELLRPVLKGMPPPVAKAKWLPHVRQMAQFHKGRVLKTSASSDRATVVRGETSDA